MKTNNTEYKVVKYFVEHRTGDTWIEPFYKKAITYRQMRQSAKLFWVFAVCFFATLLIAVSLHRYQVVATYVGYLWGLSVTGMFVFGLRAASKFFRHLECKDDSTTTLLLEKMDSFRKLFGKFPGQLGRRGVAKRLMKQVKRILNLEAKKRDTYDQHEHLRKMYDTAKMFTTVNTYEELFAAARAGKEIPPYVPSPED